MAQQRIAQKAILFLLSFIVYFPKKYQNISSNAVQSFLSIAIFDTYKYTKKIF
nr:MAG TPA: hypothetical protein [Caudoviricetes sp.]